MPQAAVLDARCAADRLAADASVLLGEVDGRTSGELTAGYTVHGGPLGDFCESLADLVAHVLMWDEINLAVLTEQRLGRPHWSLDGLWESPAIGAALNRAGVAAGREVPPELLVVRWREVRQALLSEVSGYTGRDWSAMGSCARRDLPSIGAVAQHVMTVPGHPSYWHAAIHLARIPSDPRRPVQ